MTSFVEGIHDSVYDRQFRGGATVPNKSETSMTVHQENPVSEEQSLQRNHTAVGITTLFVDDDEAFADLVAEYLEREHDIEVLTETSAEAALDRLAENEAINCIVSDYAMPEMDGLELLETVTERFPAVPFVMFAGQGSEQVASRAIRLGADDYLEKDTGETRYELLARRIDNCVTITRQEQRLQDIYDAIEHAGHAMLMTDIDGTITYANPTMVDASGYTLEEMQGETPALFKSGEHDSEFYRELWETILSGSVWQGEVVNEHKKGHQYVVDQTISPITDNGTITGFVAINRDITARKRRERNLTFFKQAIDQVGTGIAAYDEEGTVRYANDAYAEMLGTTTDALNGRSITSVNPEFDPSQFRKYWESFETGETRRREGMNQRFDDGTTFPVDAVTTHISVGDDDFHIGTIQDITERKEREQELQIFRKAVEQAGHAVVVTDTDGVIEYVNPAFEELTGYDSEEATGATTAILQSGEHDDAFYESLWETILDGNVWEGEIVNERKDGERYIIDQTIAPLKTAEGEITHFVAINHDITELKEQKQELQRQNDRLENFGRTVAHDLRNPLNVMESRLGMARQTDDPEEAHAEMQQAIDRMSELIDELLALAKHGTSVLDPEQESLESVATTAWEHVNTQVMTLEVADDTSMKMDNCRVRELFENLFRNAREHAGADAAIRVGSLESGFYVEDDGPGIPPEKRDDVLKSGFTTSTEGTGFGLAIVSQIAEAHGWEVTVTEGANGGARFEFRSVET